MKSLGKGIEEQVRSPPAQVQVFVPALRLYHTWISLRDALYTGIFQADPVWGLWIFVKGVFIKYIYAST